MSDSATLGTVTPGFSVRGILQVRTLEWVAMPSSMESSQPMTEPGSPTLQVDALPSEPPEKPNSGKAHRIIMMSVPTQHSANQLL